MSGERPSRTSGFGGPAGDLLALPCSQTLFRWNLLRLAKLGDGGSALQTVPAVLRPLVWMRSGTLIQTIERAGDAEDVIALAPEVVGAAEQAWHARLRQFDAPVVPLLGHALRKFSVLQGERRNLFVEHLVSAFFWFGDAGAAALLACQEDLDDYGRSLSSVVLGLLGHRPATDCLWKFLNYARSASTGGERLYVGPLWGLIDLGDGRAADAIAALLGLGTDPPEPRQWFFELPDFLALAGDLRCVEPVLVALALDSGQDRRQSLMMALACILQRSGRLPFAREVSTAAGTAEIAAAERFVDDLADKLGPQCDDYLRLLRRS